MERVLNAVADRPEKPQDAVLSACEQTFAVVTWSPAADNNAPITGYVVYYITSHDESDDGPHVGARVGPSDVSARVQLAPWTQYNFSVAAVNDVGVGNRTAVYAREPCVTQAGPPSRSPNRVCTNSQRPDQLVIVWEVSCIAVVSASAYCSINSGGPCNSLHSLGHFRNVYDDDDKTKEQPRTSTNLGPSGHRHLTSLTAADQIN